MLAADALRRVLLDTPRDGSVLDVGCLGFKPAISMRDVRRDPMFMLRAFLNERGGLFTFPEAEPGTSAARVSVA
ncbi:hypothetical protein ABWI00_20485 [Algihabitans albus]|uniref:hypothetical protein n=1 Tax=Algihabitans albus TaxID=2164067 RepID=UPI0035CF2C72